MKADKTEILRLAELSRLTLSDAEAVEMAAHIDNMIGFLNTANAVDTEGVPPTAHILPTVNVLRDDVAVEPMDREVLLSNAPDSDGEAYVVPAVLE